MLLCCRLDVLCLCSLLFFFTSRRRHTRCSRDWSSDVCSSDLIHAAAGADDADAERVIGAENSGRGKSGQSPSDKKSAAIQVVCHGEHLSGSGPTGEVAGPRFAIRKILPLRRRAQSAEPAPQAGRRPRPEGQDDRRRGTGCGPRVQPPRSSRPSSILDGSPVRMTAKEAVQEADVVTDKNPKTQADQARAKDKAAIKPSEAVAGKRERQGQGGGNQHHAGNRAQPENQQIEQRPLRLANGA